VDRASLTPAGFAALAEAGVIFLPLQEVVRELTSAHGGPLMAWPVFTGLFVVGVLAATARRLSRWSVTVAIGGAALIGILQSWGWGHGGAFAAAGVVVLSLAVSLRVMSLAAHDWREPIAASIAGGAAVLLLEVAVGSDAPHPWPTLMGPIIAVFFVASLASRAASVRIEEAGLPRARLDRELRAGGTSARMALPALVALTAMLGLVAAGAGHGGFLDRAGQALGLAAIGVLTVVAWIISPLAIPIAWLARFVHLDLFGLFHRLSARLPAGVARPSDSHASVMERGIQVVAFLAVAALIVWLIRRRRRLMLGPISHRPPPPAVAPAAFDARPSFRERRNFGLRRELPEVTVRRWYAEALLALERRDLRKPSHLTPAEFAPFVGRAFPSVRSAFEQLTHAYEDVRYGEREITAERLSGLKQRRTLLLETFRSRERADSPPPEQPHVDGIEAPGPRASS
jgi:hypothetical protein